jgi:hypothetical protein
MAVGVAHRISEAHDGVRLELVTGRAALRQFVELPYRLHAQDAHWVPPLRRDEYRRLSPKHNPFFEHGTVTAWIASRAGAVVGRIAAVDDRLYTAKYGEPTTWFGFFEAADSRTARALLAQVESFATAAGSTIVRGPVNPSLHESAGLLIDGFETDPYLLMPHNPPQYVDFIEDAGYRKAKDLLAWDIDPSVPLGDRVHRIGARLAARAGVTIRTVRMSSAGFAADLAALQEIYRSAWSDNWGFVPPTDAEMRQLAADLRPVLDPELVLFAEVAGRVVGCAVAIPDLNQVLKKMGGRLLPVGWVHFLRRKAIVTRLRVLMLGILMEYRRSGLYPLLITELHRRAAARGYQRAELSWTLEDNDAVNAGIEASGGRRYKTYRLYEKPLC